MMQVILGFNHFRHQCYDADMKPPPHLKQVPLGEGSESKF